MSPWLLGILVLGAGALYVANANAQSVAAPSTTWPPTSQQLTSIQGQLEGAVLAVTGRQALSTAETNHLANLIANMPGAYVASLPSGSIPSFSDFEAWILSTDANGQLASFSNLVAMSQPSATTTSSGLPLIVGYR